MKKNLESLCNIPNEVHEVGGYKVIEINCQGTKFFELRNSNGKVLQNYNQLEIAERQAEHLALKEAKGQTGELPAWMRVKGWKCGEII